MARKSSFALQSVLDYRRHLEDAAASVLAALQRSYDRSVAEAERLNAKADREHVPISGARRVSDLIVAQLYLRRLRAVAQFHASVAADVAPRLEAARRDALGASRDRRTIELLGGRFAAARAARMRRARERDIAEIASLRAVSHPF